MESLRILLGDNDETFLTTISGILVSLGYSIIGTETSGTSLLRKIRTMTPDAVIVDAGLRGMSGFEISDIVEGEGICPCIITFRGSPSEFAMKLEKKLVYSYIQKPVNSASVSYAIDNAYFNFKKVMQLEERLQQRKIVEKAKGLLMKRYNYSEDKAYEYLRKKSMDKCVPIHKIAKAVIDIIQNKND